MRFYHSDEEVTGPAKAVWQKDRQKVFELLKKTLGSRVFTIDTIKFGNLYPNNGDAFFVDMQLLGRVPDARLGVFSSETIFTSGVLIYESGRDHFLPVNETIEVQVTDVDSKLKVLDRGHFFLDQQRLLTCYESNKDKISKSENIAIVSPQFNSSKQYYRIVSVNTWAIRQITNPTHEMRLAVAGINPDAQQYACQPEEICLEAVKTDGLIIRKMGDPEKTKAVCLAAVEQEGSAIRYISNPTLELCLLAIEKYSNNLQYIKDPPFEACLLAIEKNGSTIRFVKDQNEKICLRVVRENGSDLQYILKENRTDKICLEAVKQDHCAILHVGQEHMTLELCIIILAKDPQLFSNINKSGLIPPSIMSQIDSLLG